MSETIDNKEELYLDNIDFYNAYKLKLAIAGENRKLQWARSYHKNTRGKNMSLDKLPFQIGIYNSLMKNRYVVLRKSVQNGISETFVVSHLEEADRGLSILYVLPKTEIRNTYVQNRINKLIKSVPFYRDKMKNAVGSTDNIILKGFGKGIIKYVDSNSSSNFVEYPADALYIDEVDQCNQNNLLMAIDRLESSEYKFIRKVANPSVEDYGIDIDFKAGTQKYWFVKCDRCGEWQDLDWFRNIVTEIDKRQYDLLDMDFDFYNLTDTSKEVGVFCTKCNQRLNRLGKGQWVSKHPNRDIDSFQISKLFTPFTSMLELSKRFNKAISNDTAFQLFYNSELGLPFSAKGAKITADMLNDTRDMRYFMPDFNTEGLVYAGIDVGKVLNIIIRKWTGTKKVALYIGVVKDEKDVLELFERYGVKVGVIDAMPETRMVERMKLKFDRLYSCWYRSVVMITVDKKKKVVAGKRTPLIDRVAESFNKDQYVNPANLSDTPEYYEQMGSSTRVLDPELKPPDYQWREVGADHYLHAETYAEVAFEIASKSMLFGYADDYEDEEEKAKENEGKSIHQQVNENTSKQDVLNTILNKNMGGNGFGGMGD